MGFEGRKIQIRTWGHCLFPGPETLCLLSIHIADSLTSIYTLHKRHLSETSPVFLILIGTHILLELELWVFLFLLFLHIM